MKNILTISLLVVTLCTTTTVSALTPIPPQFQAKAQTTFDDIYKPMRKKSKNIQIQELKTSLNTLIGKQEIYKKLDPAKDSLKTLILQKIEDLNKSSPTYYP
jgi:hypothetical protein